MPYKDPPKDKQFKPGESGNPDGKPKGTIHLSTHIQNLLNDPEFIPEKLKEQGFTGTPMKAIILTAMKKAEEGDTKWAEWLGKHGYGTKLQLSNDPENPITPIAPETIAKFNEFLKNETKQ